MPIYSKSRPFTTPKASIISDILQNSKLYNIAIELERDVILQEQQEVHKQLEKVVFDHLYAVEVCLPIRTFFFY